MRHFQKEIHQNEEEKGKETIKKIQVNNLQFSIFIQ